MDRPILFSGPMVRALLAGTKTQTRRVMRPQPELQPNGFYHVHNAHGGLLNVPEEDVGREAVEYVPYARGDRLWVRETVCLSGDEVYYRTNEPGVTVGLGGFGRWTPSLHMPRRASRLTLHVTEVRVQRLLDISDQDAIAEGLERSPHNSDQWINYPPGSSAAGWRDPRESYRTLWDSLNAERGLGWHSDPWVVAISFTVERHNIDESSQP